MDKIRERREALKITQAELAALAGVKQSQVSAAETAAYVSRPARARIVAALTLAESRAPNETGAARNTGTMAKLSPSMVPVLETALGKAFNADAHLLRDANAVLSAFGVIALPQMTDAELQRLCRQWLDAAATLRADGVPVTSQALVARLALRGLNTH